MRSSSRAPWSEVDPTQPLRVPESLEGLVRARLDELPPATRESLVLAAAVGRPSSELLTSLDISARMLDPAVAAGVIERTDRTIHFVHPLLASAVYYGVPAEERRRAHGRLAEVVVDPHDRARHLALSIEDADAHTAGFLEEAAALASSRGVAIVAAELAEHALRLTPQDAHDDRHRRALATARTQRSAGERTRARSVLGDLLAETRAGPVRAEALVLLAELESERDSVPLLEEALREAATRPALQSVIHCRLAWASPKPRFDHAQKALDLADELDDDLLGTGTRNASNAQLVRWRGRSTRGSSDAGSRLPRRRRW